MLRPEEALSLTNIKKKRIKLDESIEKTCTDKSDHRYKQQLG